MTTAVGVAALAVACGVAQAMLTVAIRSDVRRVAELKTETPERRGRELASFERVGRLMLRVMAGRRSGLATAAEPLVARSVGAATVLAVCLLPFGPLAAMAGGAAGWLAPRAMQRKEARARTLALANDLPEVVDLLVLALGAGLNVPLAVHAVGRRGTGPLAAYMAVAAEATTRGQRLADALDDVSARCGEQVRPLMSLLAAGERYGVPLGESLDRLSVDVRAVRRRREEERARRLPVKMLFPLVVCILPAFALLTLGPMLLTSLRDLSW